MSPLLATMVVLAQQAVDPVTQLDPQHLIPLITGTLIPLLTAIVTKWNAASGLKAVVTLTLSAVASILSTVNVTSWSEFNWKVLGVHFALTWAMSLVADLAAWKPTKIAPAIALATPGGIGHPPMETDAPLPPHERTP